MFSVDIAFRNQHYYYCTFVIVNVFFILFAIVSFKFHLVPHIFGMLLTVDILFAFNHALIGVV